MYLPVVAARFNGAVSLVRDQRVGTMSTSTLQVRCTVRPTRLAFALREPDERTLIEVMRLNATLWGGVFNPIFFVDGSRRVQTGEQETLGRQSHEQELLLMLRHFDPDLIIKYSGTALPVSLKAFEHRSFPETVLRWKPTGDQDVSYFLEVWPFIEQLGQQYRRGELSDKQFRYLATDPQATNTAYLGARFGLYPAESQGDERLAALLEAKSVVYDQQFRSNWLPMQHAFPISLTSVRLHAPFPAPLFNLVFFALDPHNLFDVVDYWNLRAAGLIVCPLPISEYRDFGAGIVRFAQLARYRINPSVTAFPIVIKGRSVSDVALEEMTRWIETLGVGEIRRQGWFPRFSERSDQSVRELDVKPVWSKESTNIVLTENGYGRLQGPTPDCDLEGTGRSQHWSTELQFYTTSGEDQCYHLPWLRPKCDEVANRALGHHFGISAGRVSKQGLVAHQEGNRGDIRLVPIKIKSVLSAVLDGADLKFVGMSSPGLAAERIIENLGGGGIHLTHLTPTCSISAYGGLPSNAGGAGGSLQFGAGVPGLPVPASVARRVSLSALRRGQSVAAGIGLVAVCALPSPSIGDSRNDLPGYPHCADGLVPSDVVGDGPEKRRQRSGAATRVGLGKLPNGLGLAP